MDKTVLTYGTFDLLHIGHLRMLQRLRALGDRLVVGVSTDEFNQMKGKKSVYSFEERSQIVNALECVDLVIPETSWEQKEADIKKHHVNIFGIGEDWRGEFNQLESLCEVVYLRRTPSISSTAVKKSLATFNSQKIQEIKSALDGVLDIIKAIE